MQCLVGLLPSCDKNVRIFVLSVLLLFNLVIYSEKSLKTKLTLTSVTAFFLS